MGTHRSDSLVLVPPPRLWTLPAARSMSVGRSVKASELRQPRAMQMAGEGSAVRVEAGEQPHDLLSLVSERSRGSYPA